jgi:hypothetical protein
LQHKGIHNGGGHPHVIGGGSVHAEFGAVLHASKNVTPPHHNGDVYAEFMGLLDFFADFAHDFRLNAKTLIAHKGFTTDFEQNSFKARGGGGHGFIILLKNNFYKHTINKKINGE